MSDPTLYGIKSTGFVRKDLTTILADIETNNEATLTDPDGVLIGAGLIQTSDSPLGQLNGLAADEIGELWERAEDLYQSVDPDQAEGTRLDTLGKLRLLSRGAQSDIAFRQTITNEGQGRTDLQDVVAALEGLTGVTFARVLTNNGGANPEIPKGAVAVAVIGGDDDEIALTLRDYLVPGIDGYGNHAIESVIDGFCRSMTIIRPVDIPVTLALTVKARTDLLNCPAPLPETIRDSLVAAWPGVHYNGQDVTEYELRKVIECSFSNIEVCSFTASRDGVPGVADADLSISLFEIASFATADVTVTVVQ